MYKKYKQLICKHFIIGRKVLVTGGTSLAQSVYSLLEIQTFLSYNIGSQILLGLRLTIVKIPNF